ncbi:MAG: ATP-binding protein [Treponema sp.]|jgi:predicted AAA+ superfamily ATPase|nr:ATP-binding protein [Treponema sp.]
MVQRKEYLARLEVWREKQVIKVVSGVRRCGKSTLLSQYIDWLRASGVDNEQIVSINLEDPEFGFLLNHGALYAYILKRLLKKKYTYVFIDEVQQCVGFEKAIDGLFIKKNVDLYITGSNAYMLSGELATLLSGRYVELNMLPLSFAEYIAFNGSNGKKKVHDYRAALNNYLRFGSFPYAATLNADAGMVKTYIDGIYNSILIKDVAKRTGATDIALLENIIKFLSHSVGSPISAKKISDTINSSGRKISVNTVDFYLRSLTDSFIFYHVDRYDIKGKQYLKTLGKYYIVDTGIRNMLLESSSPDLGHQLENIVYLELLRRGLRVSIGKLDEKEVDFITAGAQAADDGSGTTAYYQVAASVMDQDTLARELSVLSKIRDNHPKYLLTLDDIPSMANHDGIIQKYLIDWLLEKRKSEGNH